MREKYFEEWSKFSNEFMNRMSDIRRTLLNIINKRSEVTKEDLEELYKKIDQIERSSKIFIRRYTFLYRENQQGSLQILNDDRVKKFLKHFENADSIEGLSEMDIWNVRDVGGTALTSLGAIVNSRLFIPLHEHTINNKVRRKIGLEERFWSGSDKHSREKVERFLISLKKAAEEVEIDNLLEAAFLGRVHQGAF